MRFSYNKLFKLLIDKGIKDISATSIAKLGHEGNVNTEVLLKICNALNCDVGDIMEFTRNQAVASDAPQKDVDAKMNFLDKKLCE